MQTRVRVIVVGIAGLAVLASVAQSPAGTSFTGKDAGAPAAKEKSAIDTQTFGWLRTLIAPKQAVVLVIEEHGRETGNAGAIRKGDTRTKGRLLRGLMRTSLTYYTKDDVDWSLGYEDVKSATNIVLGGATPTNLPVLTISEQWSSKGGYATMNGVGTPVAIFNMQATLRIAEPNGHSLFEKVYGPGEYGGSYSADAALPSLHAQKALTDDIVRGTVLYEPLLPNQTVAARSVEETIWESDSAMKEVIEMKKGGRVQRLNGTTTASRPTNDRWQQVGDVVRVWFNDGFGLFEGRLVENTLEGKLYSSFGMARTAKYHLRKE